MCVEGNTLRASEAIAYTVGDIIGSGIFVAPCSILRHTGSVGLSVAVWLAGAAIAVLGALVYIELGTKIRRSGCDFAYLMEARWEPVAVSFLYVSCLLIYPAILAIQTLAFGGYIVAGLQKMVCLDNWSSNILRHLIGFTALFLLVFVNLFSLRNFAGKLQLAVTISKLAVISMIILIGLYHLIFMDGTKAFREPFKDTTTNPSDVGLALYASLYAYNGWDILNFGTEEVENPRRTLPLAALTGIGLSALVFVSMNVAYFAVLTKDEFLSGDTVAVLFARKTMGDFSYVVPFLIGLLLLGNLNTTIFGCSRYVLAGARRSYFPTCLATVSRASASPRAAILAEMLVAVSLTFVADLEHLLGIMTFAMWTQRAIVQVALLWMRNRGQPYPKDAFVTPIVLPLFLLVISVALVVVPVVKDLYVAYMGPPLVLLGLLVYSLLIYPQRRFGPLQRLDHGLVVGVQVLLDAEISTTKVD